MLPIRERERTAGAGAADPLLRGWACVAPEYESQLDAGGVMFDIVLTYMSNPEPHTTAQFAYSFGAAISVAFSQISELLDWNSK